MPAGAGGDVTHACPAPHDSAICVYERPAARLATRTPCPMEANAATPAPAPGAEASPSESALVRLIRRWGEQLPDEEGGRKAMARTAASAAGELEGRLGPMLARPLREHGLEPLARQVERNPIATIAGAVVAGWLARRILR